MAKNKTNNIDFETLLEEIKDYFNSHKDEDYMSFDDHPLANEQDLMDPDKPAPWDHLANEEDDGDIDIDVEDV